MIAVLKKYKGDGSIKKQKTLIRPGEKRKNNERVVHAGIYAIKNERTTNLVEYYIT